MAKGVRRTLEQQLEDAKKLAAELEAKIKAQSSFNADHKAVKGLIADAQKVANDNGWAVKDVVKAIADTGSQAGGGTPEDLGAFIKTETAKWAEVIKAGNITLQ